jgi:uncharacterized membrane protein YheB (UPF0754 family)
MPAQDNPQTKSSEKTEKSPSLEKFIDQLIEEKDYPVRMDPAVIEKIKADLLDLLQRTINAKILTRLNKEERQKFVNMIKNNKPQEITQEFIKEKVPDLESFLAQVLSDFRKKYLGRI